MKNLILLVLLLINSASALEDDYKRFHSIEESKKPEKVSVQLHWKYQFQYAGFIAAKEQGFYEDVGLDVELKEYEFGTDIVDEVVSGRSTFGVYNSNILVEYLQDRSIKLVASYFKRSALVLITSTDIKFPKDLLGKTIMANGREDFNLNFKYLFDEYGVNSDQLKLVKHTYDLKDFVNKNVDAMTAFISDQPYKLDKMGVKYNVINPSELGMFNLQLELFTSKDEVKNNPDRVKLFRDATKKGWEYALRHKDETVKLIYDKYSKNISIDSLKNEAREIEKLILPKIYDIGSMDKSFLLKQCELLKMYYKINDTIYLDDFLFTPGNSKIDFTLNEFHYINTTKPIKVCVQPNIFPIDGYASNAQAGIMADIYSLISKKSGLKFVAIESSSVEELRKNVINKTCQIVSVNVTNSNKELLIHTRPFIESYFTLITKLDKSFVQDISILEDVILVVQSQIFKEHILKSHPKLNITVQRDPNRMMKNVLDGNAYAALSLNESADYLVEQYGYGKLKINGFISKENKIKGSIGILKDETVLADIIQKSLDAIPPQKIDSIIKSWMITRYHSETDYSLVWKILIAVSFLVGVMAYHQRKLSSFNAKLASEVKIKTHELKELNESLELTVAEKVQELIQKDKILTAQSKQAVMGEMISMIAHQWRQPLSNITLQISNLQLTKLMGGAIDEEKTDKTLSEISDSIIYLSNTIDDFQTYFHPDKKSTKVEIHELLQKVVNFTLPKINATNISIHIKKEREIYIQVYMNELIQVILNLINNAIDAFEEVDRENKAISLYVKSYKDRFCICVEDNASGISEENMKKLFEPYFSTKGKNGTGLGLYMSQMIIQKQFGGDIKVETSPRGSTFMIEIRDLN
ncbi:ABC transporter substrate-binding protein [bacterium]|nr:ABC transporter substrate-binding protein [bacterium]MBU1990427.1 ABC transporter substrate-binding protein [bacterium]